PRFADRPLPRGADDAPTCRGAPADRPTRGRFRTPLRRAGAAPAHAVGKRRTSTTYPLPMADRVQRASATRGARGESFRRRHHGVRGPRHGEVRLPDDGLLPPDAPTRDPNAGAPADQQCRLPRGPRRRLHRHRWCPLRVEGRRLFRHPAFRAARARERRGRSGDSLLATGCPAAERARPVPGGGIGVPATGVAASRAIRMLALGAIAAVAAPAVARAESPSAPEKAVFASPAPGSAVGLLSELIKEKKLDERNGILLDVKYFDPAATEQAVILRRADAGIFPVVSAA